MELQPLYLGVYNILEKFFGLARLIKESFLLWIGVFSDKIIIWCPSTVLPKAAITFEWSLLLCARFTSDIYAKFVLLLLKNEEVEKLECELSGYIGIGGVCFGHKPYCRQSMVSGFHQKLEA